MSSSRKTSNIRDDFCISNDVKTIDNETEEETEQAPDYGEGFPLGEPQGCKNRGNRGAWPTGFIPQGHPQIEEGL